MGILRFISGRGNMSVDLEIGLVSRYVPSSRIQVSHIKLMG